MRTHTSLIGCMHPTQTLGTSRAGIVGSDVVGSDINQTILNLE